MLLLAKPFQSVMWRKEAYELGRKCTQDSTVGAGVAQKLPLETIDTCGLWRVGL